MSAHDAYAYIALGSNLGDRRDHLERAVGLLAGEAGTCLRRSHVYDTSPLGCDPGQDNYLNAVIEMAVCLDPLDLLDACMNIEHRMGRVRRRPNEARLIDLDILLYDDCVVDTPRLTLPHPRMHLRRFVLEPLAELIPDWCHPRTRQTVLQMQSDLCTGANETVTRCASGWLTCTPAG